MPLISRASDFAVVATPSASWHVGVSPSFPSSLTISNNKAIESITTDVPFLAVGLLGFGVTTFFFVLRNFNLPAFCAFASAIFAFLAGILDIGQVLDRGEAAANNDTHVSSVLPLLIVREVTLGVSVGFRLLFFWAIVSPRRGDKTGKQPSAPDAQSPSFLQIDQESINGRDERWDLFGTAFKYALLLAIIAIVVLQLLWRMIANFNRAGPVYNVDAALEIGVSTLFIIKLFVNLGISRTTRRWKFLKSYSPVVVALLIGMGVNIGNFLCFQFSESPLGRLLQTVELYIMILYSLISTFNPSGMTIVVAPQMLQDIPDDPPYRGQKNVLVDVSAPVPPDKDSTRIYAPKVPPPPPLLILDPGSPLGEPSSPTKKLTTSGPADGAPPTGRDREKTRDHTAEDTNARLSRVDDDIVPAATFEGGLPKARTVRKSSIGTPVRPSAPDMTRVPLRTGTVESPRQQQSGLDTTIAKLSLHPTIGEDALAAPSLKSESLRSEVSLSNFPEPPPISPSLVNEMSVLRRLLGAPIITDRRRQISLPFTPRPTGSSYSLDTRAVRESRGTQDGTTSIISTSKKPVRYNDIEQGQGRSEVAGPVESVQARNVIPRSTENSAVLREIRQGPPRRQRANVSGPISRVDSTAYI